MESCHSSGWPRRGDPERPFSDGLDWPRLWSTARVELGLSDTEFWGLTLYELELLTLAHRRKQRFEALPMAVLVQVMCNVNRDSKARSQPFEVEEVLQWFGHAPDPGPPPPEPPKPTVEELREKFRMLSMMYPNGASPEGHEG